MLEMLNSKVATDCSQQLSMKTIPKVPALNLRHFGFSLIGAAACSAACGVEAQPRVV
jgi:hypothetical protein